MKLSASNWKQRSLALATASVVATVVSTASAAVCVVPFTNVLNPVPCREGSSSAMANHFLAGFGGTLRFSLMIDFQGGDTGAVAFGIDEDGNTLDQVGTMAGDSDNRSGKVAPLDAERLLGLSGGPLLPSISYTHEVNIASTEVVVF